MAKDLKQMTDKELAQTLYIALKLCGKFLRDTPPGDLDAILKEKDMISVLCGGVQRDPEGVEWVSYWVKRALDLENE